MTVLEEARAELREFTHGERRFEYAYAFGHGCSLGDSELQMRVRRRVMELRAIISEHS